MSPPLNGSWRPCLWSICKQIFTFGLYDIWLLHLGSGLSHLCTVRCRQQGTHFRFNRPAFINHNQSPTHHQLKTYSQLKPPPQAKQGGAYGSAQGPGGCWDQPKKTGRAREGNLDQTYCSKKSFFFFLSMKNTFSVTNNGSGYDLLFFPLFFSSGFVTWTNSTGIIKVRVL